MPGDAEPGEFALQTSADLWRRYGRPAIPTLLCVYVPLGALLVGVKLASPHQHASVLVEPGFSPTDSLTRGSLWIAGLAGWTWAAVACLLGLLGVGRSSPLEGFRRLFAGAGVLTLLVFADDLFQLHKPVIPDATGIPSGGVLAIYGIAFGAWLWVARRVIAQTELGVLCVAVAFFALWLFAKAAPGIPGRIPISSGAKLCGIAGWAAYLTVTVVRSARSTRAERALHASG